MTPDPAAVFSGLDLSGRKSAVVALSGGGDSVALLHLFRSYASRELPGLDILAVTIDHGLRPESASEAAEVGRFCAGLGVRHSIVRWEGDKPASGVTNAARDARYRLLAEAALRAGTDVVLVGHTQDDLAETVLMRSARSEGRGSAGIAPATCHRGVWFVRPLLDTTRQALRQYLVENDVRWIDDPSNDNLASERVRARKQIGGDDRMVAKLAAQAALAAADRAETGHKTAQLIERHARFASAGLVGLPVVLANGDEAEGGIYAFRLLLSAVGGGEQLPDLARTQALLGRLTSSGFRATLSRTVIETRAGMIWLRREARDLPSQPAVEGAVWDRRFYLEKGDAGLTIAPAGSEHAREIEPPDGIPASLVRAALAAEPGLWREGVFLGGGGTQRTVELSRLVPPWLTLLPSFDLTPANAIAALLEAESFPPPPLGKHIGRKA